MTGGFSPFDRIGDGRLAAAAQGLRAAWVGERERWPLWLPVILGGGVGFYFALPVEPPRGVGMAATLACVLLALLLKRRPSAVVMILALACAAAGFAAAQSAALRAAAPVLERETGPLTVSGRVLSVETVTGGQRVVLDRLTFADARTPLLERVRLRVGGTVAVRPGQRLEVRAVLMPPQPPAMPGAFDFARQAWFASVGAIGYAVGRAEVLPEAAAGGWVEAAGLWLADIRHALTQRVAAGAGGGSAGAVSAALVTGEQAAIPRALLDAYRDSGLAHLLSISGLHMSMVAGFAFLMVRAALALAEPVALRHPIKKWAAVVALLAGFVYLLLAGSPVPTQRSFLTVAIVFLAVLFDRNAISLRLVAWSAFAVLLWQPQALIGASFQMSFAAVVALVAAYEGLGPRMAAWRTANRGWATRAVLYVGGVALTTLIAGSATTVYGLYHFNRVASYALAANLVAVPLTGLWVMPWALIAVLLMPLGLDGPALTAMGWGVEAVNRVAEVVAGWPGAAFPTPPMPGAGLIVFTLGGLWLCLWRGRWRYWGVAAMLAGMLSIGTQPLPDILIDGDGDLMAVRAAEGGLVLAAGRGDAFQKEMWLRRAGGGQPFGRPPPEGPSGDGRLSCDATGCLYRAAGHTVALMRSVAAAEEDCAVASVVVSAVPLRRHCREAAVTVDRFDLWRHGAHALWLLPQGVAVETVADWQGRRPWARWPQ